MRLEKCFTHFSGFDNHTRISAFASFDDPKSSPCFLRECPIDFRCMKAVSVAEVRDAIISILQRKMI